MVDGEQSQIGEFTQVARARRRIERIQHEAVAAIVGGDAGAE